jgi:hypothetical protein
MEFLQTYAEQIGTYVSWLHINFEDSELLPQPDDVVEGVDRHVRSSVLYWLQTVRSSGSWVYSSTWLPSQRDAAHSSLLARILHGYAVLPTPPPLAYGEPWYELIDNKTVWISSLDIELSDNEIERTASTLVMCGQRWRILEREDRTWIISCDQYTRAELVRCTSSPDVWKVTLLESPELLQARGSAESEQSM